MRTKWTIDFSANSSPPWGSSWGWIACEQVKGLLSVCPPNVRGVFPGSEVSKPFPQKGQMTNIFSLASHLIHVANTRFCLWSLNAAVDTQKQMGVAKLAWEQKGLDPCYSKHGSWSSNISMPWKLVRNAESQTPLGAAWIRICCSQGLFLRLPHTSLPYRVITFLSRVKWRDNSYTQHTGWCENSECSQVDNAKRPLSTGLLCQCVPSKWEGWPFCSRRSSQGCLCSKLDWWRLCLPQGKGLKCSVPGIKHLGSLSLGHLLCNVLHCMRECAGLLQSILRPMGHQRTCWCSDTTVVVNSNKVLWWLRSLLTHLPFLKERKFPGWIKVEEPIKCSRQLLPATPFAFNSTRKEGWVEFTFP